MRKTLIKEGRVKLGDHVKDKLTDLEGTVTAISFYLYGCKQCEVQSRKLINGLIVEGAWIDEPQLIVIKPCKPKKVKPLHGGVRSHPGG